MAPFRNKRIQLNISGEIFETFEATLTRYPDTLLGDAIKRNSHFCATSNNFFFDRNRLCFEAILYFYQSNGVLNCPRGVHIPAFEEECRFFELGDDVINGMKMREGIFELKERIPTQKLNSFQIQMWNLLEYPNSSQAAWVFSVFSLAVVWVSIVTTILETMPWHGFHSNIATIELVLHVWFLIELVTRFTFCTNKANFMFEMLTWVDVLAVVPYFLFVMIFSSTPIFFGMFKMFKLTRVMRLTRLTRHSTSLKVVAIILKMNVVHFKLLFICLSITLFLGATVLFFAENEVNQKQFASITHCLWWAIQTITSVGYGDTAPISAIGRFFASCFMLFGVLTYLPLLSIVIQFTSLYPKNVEYDEYRKIHKNRYNIVTDKIDQGTGNKTFKICKDIDEIWLGTESSKNWIKNLKLITSFDSHVLLIL